MGDSAYIRGKTKRELVESLYDSGAVGSRVHEQIKMGVVVVCTEDIEKALSGLEVSMNNNAASSESLARKVLYLNVVLSVATAIGTIVAVIDIVRKIYHLG